jgi:NADH oxidase (H2O2-forming)
MQQRDVVIIGGGPAGRVLVHSLHKMNSNKSVALIKDEALNVNRCAVPFGIDGRKPLDKYMIPNNLVTDFGADLVIDRVAEVNSTEHLLVTTGGDLFKYRHLLFATGSRPFIPDIPGANCENVVPVRAKSDLVRLRDLAAKSKRAVVIGAGFIGIETASVLKKMGLQVTLVSKYRYVMQSTFEPDLAPLIHQDLLDNGIEIYPENRAEAFNFENKKAISVVLSDGTELAADFFIIAIGVVPNIELAKAAGLEVSSFGIITDQTLKTSATDIYASGDCAEKKSFISGKPVKGEFGTNAVFMSKIIAANIEGKSKKFAGVMNASCATAFEVGFGSVGLREEQAMKHGIEAVCGEAEVLDKYPMMNNVDKIKAKLIFNKMTRRLIGGSVVRKGLGAAQNIDFLSLAIQMGVGVEDLLAHQYSTHPELAAKPSDNLYVFAAEDAAPKL